MTWNLQSSFEWKNATFLGGQNILWRLLHIFGDINSDSVSYISCCHSRGHMYKSSFAMYPTLMSLQIVECAETFLTQRTPPLSIAHVDFHVSVQNSRRPTCFATQMTYVRFLSRVNSRVHIQTAGPTEWLVTQVTVVRFLSTVNTAVHDEVVRRCKPFATNDTTVRLIRFIRVDSHAMKMQMYWLSENYVAPVTFVRFLSTVNSTVHYQRAVSYKSFAANGTPVSFVSRVDFQVSMHSSGLTECSPAHVTFVRFISTVNSTVYLEVTWRCRSFSANSTLKRLLSRMNASVYFQRTTALTTPAAFLAPVQIITCLVNWLRDEKHFSQWVHVCKFSPVCPFPRAVKRVSRLSRSACKAGFCLVRIRLPSLISLLLASISTSGELPPTKSTGIDNPSLNQWCHSN